MKKVFVFVFLMVLLSACSGERGADYAEPDDLAYEIDYEVEYDIDYEIAHEVDYEAENDNALEPELEADPEPVVNPGEYETDEWVWHVETTIPVSEGISITLAIVTDELLDAHENYLAISHRGGDPRQSVSDPWSWGSMAIISTVPVRNFRFLRVDSSWLEFIVEEDLLVLDELPGNTPLFIDWEPTGSMAYAGFALEDEDGITRYFAFNTCVSGDSAFRWREFFSGWNFMEDGNLVPASLTVVDIPADADAGAFLRGLGFPMYQFLDLGGSERIALINDMPVSNVRKLWVIPYYTASFSGEWFFERFYYYYFAQQIAHSFANHLAPLDPLVITWHPYVSITEIGLYGISFSVIGHYSIERTYILRQENGVSYVTEFENTPPDPTNPLVTRRPVSDEIELYAIWMIENRDFLEQFEAYTTFENPEITADIWVAFNTNVDLRDFQFFSLDHAEDPWVGEEWHPFYVGTILGAQDVLPVGTPVVVPWHPFGTWPHFGISFLDETGQRRTFSLNSNNGSGFPPMFIQEFTDRGYY